MMLAESFTALLTSAPHWAFELVVGTVEGVVLAPVGRWFLRRHDRVKHGHASGDYWKGLRRGYELGGGSVPVHVCTERRCRWCGYFVTTRRLRVEWKPQDCWVGVFWKQPRGRKRGGVGALDVWVCLLPMVPIHFTSQRSWVCGQGSR